MEQEPFIYSTLEEEPDLAEIVGLFVADLATRVATMQGHLEAAEWDGLRRAAHQLKGAGGSYGFTALSTAAACVEDAIVAQQPEAVVRQAAGELIDLCRRVRFRGST